MRRRPRRDSREADIRAPDGFLLGGLRKVRADGTILFLRDWWAAPKEWIGEKVWLHVTDGWATGVEAAPPGMHIFKAQLARKAVQLEATGRPSAKPGYRKSLHKAWAAR